MEMFTATMLEVFPTDCCDYRAVDTGHPRLSLSAETLLGTCWGRKDSLTGECVN